MCTQTTFTHTARAVRLSWSTTLAWQNYNRTALKHLQAMSGCCRCAKKWLKAKRRLDGGDNRCPTCHRTTSVCEQKCAKCGGTKKWRMVRCQPCAAEVYSVFKTALVCSTEPSVCGGIDVYLVTPKPGVRHVRARHVLNKLCVGMRGCYGDVYGTRISVESLEQILDVCGCWDDGAIRAFLSKRRFVSAVLEAPTGNGVRAVVRTVSRSGVWETLFIHGVWG